jgi:hypothetical protein
MKSFLIKLVFIIIAGISGAACGVKSMPSSPDGATYPAQYPLTFAPIKATPMVLKQNNPSAPAVQDPNSFWQYPNTPPTK